MFELNLRDEDVIMRLKVKRLIKKKDMISNFIGNLLTAAGGDIADKVYLTLTKDSLYLEYIGHGEIGYVEEIRRIDKLSLEDIKEFLIIVKDDEEVIKIATKNKEFSFIRDNLNKDNLALAMGKVIKGGQL